MISNVDSSGTLLERIGGIPVVENILNSLYDELLETEELEHFFRDAPIETIKTHQSVVFRLLLGSDELRPTEKNMINYMLQSHARLFRDAGLNETHFDVVVRCLLETFEVFHVNTSLVNEIVSILAPLRTVFEYGAKVAAEEKYMSRDQLASLPACSAATIGSDIAVILPKPQKRQTPSWLDAEIRKVTKRTSLREWTSNLSDRCSGTGDLALADVMMGIPFFQLEPYLSNFMQLAFAPDNMDVDVLAKLVKLVRYPRGFSNEPLPRSLYERMIMAFCKTCDDMNVKSDDTKVLVTKLQKYTKSFPKLDPTKKNGVTNPLQILFDKSDEFSLKSDKMIDSSEGSFDNRKRNNATSPTHITFHESFTELNLSPRKASKPAASPRKWFNAVRKASMNMNPGL